MKNFKAKPPTVDKKPGKLGGPVTNYIATKLITFTLDTPILDAIDTLVEKRISGAPVLNAKREIVGMIDDKDCLRILIDRSYHSQPVRAYTVEQYMDKIMRTIPHDADILDVASIFLETTYKRLLVVDDGGKLIGQISRSDVLRAAKELGRV